VSPADSGKEAVDDLVLTDSLQTALSPDEVHVWIADLDSYLPDNFERLLSIDEVQRAHRFHFAKHRNHFVIARGLLRKLLAAYLACNPVELKFEYAAKGKPSVAAAHAIKFNLAHSHGQAAYAFSRNRELGIDIELMRQDFGGEDIARRFFSTHEVQCLETVAKDLAGQAFFNCWTRKEAYIKAIGEGLSMPLEAFDVSLAPGEPAALLQNRLNEREVERWSMQSLTAPDGYAAALVVEGSGWNFKQFTLQGSAKPDRAIAIE